MNDDTPKTDFPSLEESMSPKVKPRPEQTPEASSGGNRTPRAKPKQLLPSDTKAAAESRNWFKGLNHVLNMWFYHPDLQAIRIVLGTIKSHYLPLGDPPWLFVVAPPGTGKTTTSIMGSCGLPQVLTLGDVTENTFLSGFYGAVQPGLLEKLGDQREHGSALVTEGNAVILIKDFTTVLSMRREKRAAILSQLREIHDGEFKRSFGTGETKIWRGWITVIAAVTPALDRHYSIFSTLGERFLQVRWHRPDSAEAGEWAIRQQGREDRIRTQLQILIKALFQDSLKQPPSLSEAMIHRIANFSEVVALCRTHIYREGSGRRDIEYVPEPEANTRIAKGLAGIAKGIAALNHHTEVLEEDLQDVLRVGIDCIPDVRRKVIAAAILDKNPNSVKATRTVKNRAIEELVALDVLKGNSRKTLTERVRSLIETAGLEADLVSRCVR